MEVSRQEYWSGLPCPPSGDLPDARLEHMSLMSPALAGEFFTTSTTWETQNGRVRYKFKGKNSKGEKRITLMSTQGSHVDIAAAAAAAKSLQSCLTLCDPIDDSPPCFSIPGILQARTLEWVAISFSSAWKWKVKVKLFSCVGLFVTPWTAASRLLCPWDFSGKSTGVGCHCLSSKIISLQLK